MKDQVAIIMSILSFLLAVISLIRTIRQRPEASWSIRRTKMEQLVSAGQMPTLEQLHVSKGSRYAEIDNDGDGDAFAVRVFGHNCNVYIMDWKRDEDGKWVRSGVNMVPVVRTGGSTMKLIICPQNEAATIPDDAEICIHWRKSPTRLRRCGYDHAPVEGRSHWWNEKDWQIHHRVTERIKLWIAHRQFHQNPKDAEIDSAQSALLPGLTSTPTD
ncbi:hypothetical protein PT279_01555 [Bifidobacterium sp. ESL0784]|uniref:hypothetical protein n=1 Tax=Bifidobacterium sp. ESL0784 TaxID=2983231 RepID=UPI0023F8FF62|nr:hypothetical protein [Bifidobacterium sp. ESL0784]MDF7640285.1 hypothetical protein [Bifidobacterium sp. ESL0784]